MSSSAQVAVGIALMIIGAVVLLFAVGGGIAQMIKDLNGPSASEGGDPYVQLEALFKALNEFLRTLIRAPTWLALVIVGFAMVGFGAWLTGQA